MRTVYAKFAEQRLRGGTISDLSAVNVKAMTLAQGLYTYSDAHEFLSSIPAPARIVSSPNLASKTFTSGYLDAADPIFTFGAAAPVVGALILYVDTGVEGTSQLIYYTDDEAGLPLTPPELGGERRWVFPVSGIFRL